MLEPTRGGEFDNAGLEVVSGYFVRDYACHYLLDIINERLLITLCSWENSIELF